MPLSFYVDVRRCDETGVLLATSSDIHGLVVEAETIGGVMDAVQECAPQLIEMNMGVASDKEYAINVRYHPSVSQTLPQSTMNVRIPLAA